VKISTADKVRVALSPLYVAIGAKLTAAWVGGARTPLVLVMGLSFVAYGVYRLLLVRRALQGRS
jgi:hypothetical protein